MSETLSCAPCSRFSDRPGALLVLGWGIYGRSAGHPGVSEPIFIRTNTVLLLLSSYYVVDYIGSTGLHLWYKALTVSGPLAVSAHVLSAHTRSMSAM